MDSDQNLRRDMSIRHWAMSWVILTFALAIHVIDEAVNDFLPLYNSLVETLRVTYSWMPFPTFTFSVWIGGLVVGVIALAAMTPLVFRGYRWLRALSLFLGALMVVNALGHIVASIWLGYLVPGVYSSPLLLAAAVALLIAAARARDPTPHAHAN